jgi:hypothetical protein
VAPNAVGLKQVSVRLTQRVLHRKVTTHRRTTAIHNNPIHEPQQGRKDTCRVNEPALDLSARHIKVFHLYFTHPTPKVSPHIQAAVCENFIVKKDSSLRSRSASTTTDKNAASVTSNIASQECFRQ